MLEPPDRLVLALVRVLWRSATDLSRAVITLSLTLTHEKDPKVGSLPYIIVGKKTMKRPRKRP